MAEPKQDQREHRCAGNDPLCPCQDGDMCHYRGPNAWPVTTPLVEKWSAQWDDNGYWYIEPLGITGNGLRGDSGECIERSRAMLIAQAPRMYEELAKVREVFANLALDTAGTPPEQYFLEAEREVAAVLAAARGESQ